MKLEQIINDIKSTGESEEYALFFSNYIQDAINIRSLPGHNGKKLIKNNEVNKYRKLFYEMYKLAKRNTNEEFNIQKTVDAMDYIDIHNLNYNFLFNHINKNNPKMLSECNKIIQENQKKVKNPATLKYELTKIYLSLNPKFFKEIIDYASKNNNNTGSI